MNWTIQLFGSFHVASPNGVALRTKSQNLKVLLALLAHAQNQRLSRRALASALFDGTQGNPLANLSVLLNRTQSALSELGSPSPIESELESIGVASGRVTIDAAEIRLQLDHILRGSEPYNSYAALARSLESVKGMPLEGLDHPSLIELRRELSSLLVEAVSQLATGPVGSHYRPLVERFVHLIRSSSVFLSHIEPMLKTVAALGQKDLLLETFLLYEARLDEEYGETAEPTTRGLFERLAQGMDSASTVSKEWEPVRPIRTFGRDQELSRIESAVRNNLDRAAPITVCGLSGIGKSHLLAELYWRIKGQLRLSYLDLERMPREQVIRWLQDKSPEVALVDHVDAESEPIVRHAQELLPGTRFICTSNMLLSSLGGLTVLLGPLEFDRVSKSGPAIDMIIDANQAVGSTKLRASDLTKAVELAELCDGIPLALRIAGRISATVGFPHTVKSMRSSLAAIQDKSIAQERHKSVKSAIDSSVDSLSDGGRRAVYALAAIARECHLDHLAFAGRLNLGDIEESLVAGLASRPAQSMYVDMPSSTTYFVNEGAESEYLKGIKDEFYALTAPWFRDKAEQKPLDLGLSNSVPLGIDAVLGLFANGKTVEALSLVATLKGWMGATQLERAAIEKMAMYTLDADPDTNGAWEPAVLSVGAAYFHTGDYQGMLDFVVKAVGMLPQGHMTDSRCQIASQLGLAYRALNRLEDAQRAYERAFADCRLYATPTTTMKCAYNLSSLVYSQGNTREAIDILASAMIPFHDSAEPRFWLNAAIDLVMYRSRAGEEGTELLLQLQSICTQALENGDRQAAAIAMQNIGMIASQLHRHLESVAYECVGCLMQLEFGNPEEYRRRVKSSFVTLCASLLRLGMRDLAVQSRMLLDRFGPYPIYPQNKPNLDWIIQQTYETPEHLSISQAPIEEIGLHLHHCLRAILPKIQVSSEGVADAVRLIAGYEEFELHPASQAATG